MVQVDWTTRWEKSVPERYSTWGTHIIPCAGLYLALSASMRPGQLEQLWQAELSRPGPDQRRNVL